MKDRDAATTSLGLGALSLVATVVSQSIALALAATGPERPGNLTLTAGTGMLVVALLSLVAGVQGLVFGFRGLRGGSDHRSAAIAGIVLSGLVVAYYLVSWLVRRFV